VCSNGVRVLFGQAGRGRGVVARGRAGGPPARGGARGARTAASAARGGGRAPARGGARAKGSLPGEDGLYLHLLSLTSLACSKKQYNLTTRLVICTRSGL
jgi:hypothetical protein